MKYLDLFSGYGGFSLGIQQAYESTRNLQSKQNCDRIDIWKKNVQNVELKNHSQSSIIQPQTQCGAKFVQEKTQEIDLIETQKKLENQAESVENETKKSITEKGENITQSEDNESLKCMGENVLAVENQKKSSLPSNIETEMDTKIEKNTEQDICINLPLKKIINLNTKSFAITAIMQEGDMENVPTCIGFSEIDRYATQVYKKHFPTHPELGDITKLNPTTLPDFDLLCGGFPCQAFSIAGKRAGFEDTRGTLIYDVFRIIKEKHPKLVLLENVKGLLSHDNGRTFKTIITSLAELGYAVEWQVLNAKNFGVPQNRERVFIIGHLGGFGGRQVFPIGESNSKDIVQLNQPNHSNNRLYGADGISPTLNTAQGGNRQPKICKPVLTPDRPNKRQNGRRFKEDGDPSFTLTGQDKHGIFDGMKIRRLTPTECERLMGLPDGWTEGVSDTQRYKLCGNGVVVNVVEEIIKRLI